MQQAGLLDDAAYFVHTGIPAGGTDHNVFSRLNRRLDIGEHGVRSREIDAHVNVGQILRPDGTIDLKDLGNGFPLLTGGRVDLAAHFTENDKCNLHKIPSPAREGEANVGIYGFSNSRTRRSYSSTPSRSSLLLIFSSAVCASKMEPGPI